ncbi:MAG: hypothetical protein P1U34_04830 [Coxiellaceae bacterium]|nr:hypothetical protein [Coxiellaceae bacterium]
MRKFFSIVQVVAGIVLLGIGFVHCVDAMAPLINSAVAHSAQRIVITEPWSKGLLISLLIYLGISSLSVAAGIELWKNNPAGYGMSAISWAIQLINFQTPHFHNVFYSLAGFIISVGKSGFGINYGVGVKYWMTFSAQPVSGVMIGINLVAAVMLFILYRLYRKSNVLSSDLSAKS